VALTPVIVLSLPAAVRQQLPPLSTQDAFIYIIQQLLVALSLGFSVRMIFAAVEFSGDIMGYQMGLSFATFMDPQNAHQSPVLGGLLGVLASLCFFVVDGHLLVIATLVKSFELIPVSADLGLAFQPMILLRQAGTIFSMGLHLALPIIGAMLICNVALGLLAKAAPQLSIFSIGFAITLLVGFGVLYLVLPFLAQSLLDLFNLAFSLSLK
jgi:flagellar biosynthetic protein FliR